MGGKYEKGGHQKGSAQSIRKGGQKMFFESTLTKRKEKTKHFRSVGGAKKDTKKKKKKTKKKPIEV